MPRIEAYDYFLPPELVAQYPLGERDASRLLVLRRDGAIRHAGFRDLPDWLDENDVLVVNDTRVFPARLLGRKDSGGKVELLLHHLPAAEADGRRPPRRPGPGHAPGESAGGADPEFWRASQGGDPGPARPGSGGGALHRGRRRGGGCGPGRGRSSPAALY